MIERGRPAAVQPLDELWTATIYHVRVENERREHAFLVRTWCETGPAGAREEWRGSVEHLPTKQRRYFRELSELTAFILTHQLIDQSDR